MTKQSNKLSGKKDKTAVWLTIEHDDFETQFTFHDLCRAEYSTWKFNRELIGCSGPLRIKIPRLFSVKHTINLMRLAWLVRRFSKWAVIEIGNRDTGCGDLLDAILHAGPGLDNEEYRKKAPYVAMAPAVLVHGLQLGSVFTRIHAAFAGSGVSVPSGLELNAAAKHCHMMLLRATWLAKEKYHEPDWELALNTAGRNADDLAGEYANPRITRLLVDPIDWQRNFPT